MAGQVMKLFTRSDYFGLQIVIPPNSLVSEEPVPPRKGEPVPAAPLILYYPTFSYASEENGAHTGWGRLQGAVAELLWTPLSCTASPDRVLGALRG